MSDKIKSLEELRKMKADLYHTIALRDYAEDPDAFRKKVGDKEADEFIEKYVNSKITLPCS